MFLAGFTLNLLSSQAVKANTEICEMIVVEGIVIGDGAPNIQPLMQSVLYCGNLLVGKGAVGISNNSGNVEISRINGDFVWQKFSSLKRVVKVFWQWIETDAHAAMNERIVGWGQPKIARREMDERFFWRNETIDNLIISGGNNPHIRPQLSSFLVAEGEPIETSKQDGERYERERNDIDRAIFLVASILMAGLGLLCISKGINRGGYFGAGVALFGYPLIVLGGCCFLYGFLNLTFP